MAYVCWCFDFDVDVANQPTWLSAFGTIAVTVTVTRTIITISPGPNAHTYAQNRRETGCRFRCENWVGDLLSPRSKCLTFLQNLRLQLSTQWPWGDVRSCHGGRAKDKVQTTISTDVIISANIRRLLSATATRYTLHAACHPPNTACQMPPASCLPVPGVCNSASLWIEHAGAYMGAYSQTSLGVSCCLRVYLGA